MPSATTVTKGVQGDFGWMFRLLSTVMTTLAIVALARHAFVTWSLSAPMALIMEAYNATMQVLLGWAHPYLQAALTWIGSWIGWRPTLYPHWRDVLVIVALLNAGMMKGVPRWTFRVAWNAGVQGVATLIAAIVAGLLDLQTPDIVTQLLIACLPLCVIRFLAPIFQYRTPGPLFSLPQRILLVGGLLLINVGPPAWFTWLLYSFGIAAAGLIGLALASISLALVVLTASPFNRRLSKDDLRTARGFALTVIGGFIGAFCFFAIDAGLKLVMG